MPCIVEQAFVTYFRARGHLHGGREVFGFHGQGPVRSCLDLRRERNTPNLPTKTSPAKIA